MHHDAHINILFFLQSINRIRFFLFMIQMKERSERNIIYKIKIKPIKGNIIQP